MRHLHFFALTSLFILGLQGCIYSHRDFVAHVYDRETQEPAAGVKVSTEWAAVLDFFPPKGASGTTDDSGKVCLKAIPDHDRLMLRVGKQFSVPRMEHRRHGGWLANYSSDQFAVWFTPAAKNLPPDLTTLDDTVPARWREER